jgi:hypothetical protein
MRELLARAICDRKRQLSMRGRILLSPAIQNFHRDRGLDRLEHHPAKRDTLSDKDARKNKGWSGSRPSISMDCALARLAA